MVDSVASNLHGFLNINKPPGLTSHDVVARIRRIYKRDTGSKKVGHTGTLDPLATGVVVICLGHATRLSDYVMHTTKQYRAQVHFGMTTDTYDAEGEILTQSDASHLTQATIESILTQFIGNIDQIPPMYSAIKQGGKKLYEMARAGKEVTRPPRPVTIFDLTIVKWESPVLTIDVTCGSGTYIRSLAYDIGQSVGVGAYLSGLHRHRSGSFDSDTSLELDQLLDDPDWHRYLVAPHIALSHMPSLILSEDDAQALQYGRAIPKQPDHPSIDTGAVMAYLPDNYLLAILESHHDTWHPTKVFPLDN